MSSTPYLREQRGSQELLGVKNIDSNSSSNIDTEVLNSLSSAEKIDKATNSNEIREQKPNPKDLEQALSNLNDYTQNINRELNFSIDEATNRTVIKVIDPESEKVIREIPSKEILAIARSIDQFSENAKGKILYTQV